MALGREKLLPYLLSRVTTFFPSNCVLNWARAHEQIEQGFEHAAQQAAEKGWAETGWILQDSDAVEWGWSP